MLTLKLYAHDIYNVLVERDVYDAAKLGITMIFNVSIR